MIFGTTWGALPAMVAAQLRDQLDAREFSSAFATMTLFYSVFAVGSGPLVGYLADRSGSFRNSFLLLAAMSAVASVAFSRLPATTRSAERSLKPQLPDLAVVED